MPKIIDKKVIKLIYILYLWSGMSSFFSTTKTIELIQSHIYKGNLGIALIQSHIFNGGLGFALIQSNLIFSTEV